MTRDLESGLIAARQRYIMVLSEYVCDADSRSRLVGVIDSALADMLETQRHALSDACVQRMRALTRQYRDGLESLLAVVMEENGGADAGSAPPVPEPLRREDETPGSSGV